MLVCKKKLWCWWHWSAMKMGRDDNRHDWYNAKMILMMTAWWQGCQGDGGDIRIRLMSMWGWWWCCQDDDDDAKIMMMMMDQYDDDARMQRWMLERCFRTLAMLMMLGWWWYQDEDVLGWLRWFQNNDAGMMMMRGWFQNNEGSGWWWWQDNDAGMMMMPGCNTGCSNAASGHLRCWWC